MSDAQAPTPEKEEKGAQLHQTILDVFSEKWNPKLSTVQVGKTLTALSICLGVVIAELTLRKIPWEVIDKNINKSVLRGVDRRIK